MIVQIAHKNGTERWYTAEHAIFHREEGKEGWLELFQDFPTRMDNSFKFKGLYRVSIWDNGRLMVNRDFSHEN